MNTIVYNENERTALEKSSYWRDDFDPETTEGNLSVQRFGKCSLLTVEFDDGGADSVLVYNGKIVFYHWTSDGDDLPATEQAILELRDKNSKFYREYLECVWPHSAAKREAEEIYSLVAVGEC